MGTIKKKSHLEGLFGESSCCTVLVALIGEYVARKVVVGQQAVSQAIFVGSILMEVHDDVAVRTTSSEGGVGSSDEGRVLWEDLLGQVGHLRGVSGVFE